jgi:dTDP-glucose 4,6-dehydratase
VLHAATDSTLGPQLRSLERYNQIVDGTRNLLDYAAANGVHRFLLTSSGGVYGPQPSQMEKIAESYHGMPDPLNSTNAYSVAKRCAEHLCALYQERFGIEVVIARCFAFLGRDLPLGVHFAIGNFIRDALQKSEVIVNGDGTPVRSYMDQRDLAEWLCTLLKHGAAGQAYNVGSEVTVTIRELAHLVRDILAPAKPVRLLGVPDAHNTRNRYVPSIYKAQSEFGLRLRHNLHASVNEVARHARL